MNNTTNSTYNNECRLVHCLFSNEERYAIIVSMFIIAGVSLIGNILVCCAFLAGDKKGSALTLSSLHLAIANLLITFFWGPIITIYLYIMGEWIFGPAMCKVMAFMQNTCVVASLLHLLVVTVEKYLAVCFPFVFRRKFKLAYHCSLAFAWLIALGESAYYIQFKKQRTFFGKHYCMEDWPDDETFRIVALTKTMVFFLILFTVMVLLALTIFQLRFGKGNFRPETSGRDESARRKKRYRHTRAVKILVVMELSVLLCWTPFHLLNIVDVGDSIEKMSARDGNIIFAVTLIFFFAVSTIHPIIFLFINQRGRALLQTGLNGICRSRKGTSRRGRSSSALDSTNILSLRKLSSGVPPNRDVMCEPVTSLKTTVDQGPA